MSHLTNHTGSSEKMLWYEQMIKLIFFEIKSSHSRTHMHHLNQVDDFWLFCPMFADKLVRVNLYRSHKLTQYNHVTFELRIFRFLSTNCVSVCVCVYGTGFPTGLFKYEHLIFSLWQVCNNGSEIYSYYLMITSCYSICIMPLIVAQSLARSLTQHQCFAKSLKTFTPKSKVQK